MNDELYFKIPLIFFYETIFFQSDTKNDSPVFNLENLC